MYTDMAGWKYTPHALDEIRTIIYCTWGQLSFWHHLCFLHITSSQLSTLSEQPPYLSCSSWIPSLPLFSPPSPHVSTLSFEAAQWRNGKDKQIEERSLTFSLSIRFSPLDWFPLPWPAACVIRLQTCCKCAFHTHSWLGSIPETETENPCTVANRRLILILRNAI